MAKAIDACVNQLLANPKFKSRDKNQSKTSAAFAVCSASLKQEANKPYVASKHDSRISLAEEVGEKGSLRFELKEKKSIKKTKKGSLPKRIELFRAGTYKHPFYGDMKMSKEVLADFVVSFEARLEAKGPNREENLLPIDVNHRGGPAYGWINKLSTSEDGDILYAHVKQWTKLGKEAIKDNLYRYVSAEFYLEGYMDFQTAEEEKNVMIAATLTNDPYMQVLMPPALGLDKKTEKREYGRKSMKDKLKKILKKDPKKLSKKEIVFLKKNKAKLSKKALKTFSSVLKTKKKAPVAPKKADKGTVNVSKKKLAKMEKDIAGFKVAEKTRTVEKYVDSMVANEGNKEARFLKKEKKGVVAFIMTLDKTQRIAFKKVVKGMPKLSLFGEIGESGSESTEKATKEFSRKVAEYREKNPKASFTEARKAVFEKNPKMKDEVLDTEEEDK